MNGRGWALVSGAGRRIGAALALAAADAGFDVIVHHLDSANAADATAQRIRDSGRQAVTARADLALPGDCAKLIACAPAPPALLVNCASAFEDDPPDRFDLELYERAMNINLRAPLVLAWAMARSLPADTDGLIVNILDQRVWRLTPRFFSYTLSKSALWIATQTMAQALAPRIRVNAIGPGPTLPSIHQSAESFAAQARATPLQHAPSPEEMGRALAYLIGARSVTGQMIAVDSGQHLAWRTPDADE